MQTWKECIYFNTRSSSGNGIFMMIIIQFPLFSLCTSSIRRHKIFNFVWYALHHFGEYHRQRNDTRASYFRVENIVGKSARRSWCQHHSCEKLMISGKDTRKVAGGTGTIGVAVGKGENGNFLGSRNIFWGKEWKSKKKGCCCYSCRFWNRSGNKKMKK